MPWTRREWMLAAGTIPLQLGAWAELAAQQRNGGRDNSDVLPPLGAAPSLPDKASFSNIRGTYLNSAATHPRPQGAMDLIRKAMDEELNEGSGLRPNPDRIRQTFAKLVNVDPTEIVLVPSTQIGESWVAAAIGLSPEGRSHVVSDELHFTGSIEMYTDMAKRGLDVSWVKIKDNRIPLDDVDRAIVKGKDEARRDLAHGARERLPARSPPHFRDCS